MEVVITPDHLTLTNKSYVQSNTMTKLNPRPVYQQSARSNATNSELDAKVVVNHANKLPRLTNNEWDTIFSLIDNNYATIREKLKAYKEEDEIVNRLCASTISDYSRIPNRY
tara:strand:+ start:24 stop:359 length:336 start_codon:yes stop_codon:yes gene_type:complete